MYEAVPQDPPSKPPVGQPVYTGSTGRLYFIILTNLLFAILTLGTHRFWGKTKLRRYLWSQFKFMDEPFAYLGTGIELFKSFLKFVFVLVLPAIMIVGISGVMLHKTPYEPLLKIINTFFIGGLSVFFMYARFSGLRYRLGRTSWRGIRFELHGRARDYVWLQIKNFTLNLLSLGLYKPMADIAVLYFLVNKIHFGNLPFAYRGRPEELQKRYFLCWLLALPTLGFSLLWYRAKYYAHMAKYVRLGAMEFRCNITGGELLKLILSNLFLVIVTLGLAYPYTVQRRMRFFAWHFKFRGTLDYATIEQARARSGSEGAELYFGGDDIGL